MFFHLRRALVSPKAFHLLVLLLYILFPLAASEPCLVNRMHNPAEYGSCVSHSYNPTVGFQDIVVGEVGSNYVAQNAATHQSMQSVCTNSKSLCFLSSLGISGSQSDTLVSLGSSNNLSRSWTDRNWSSDYGMFELPNGRKVSCSLKAGEGISLSSSGQTGTANRNYLSSCKGPLPKNKDTDVRLNEKINVSSSLTLEISPPILDWGEKFLFFPSILFLKVANKCNNSVLHVYEPFSTDKQFYPCNNSDVSLFPGEAASICFMFLPRWLGLSAAHLVLQTNSGGYLVQAKGFGVASPYGIQPLVSINVPSNPRSTKNFSLFNPLAETLYVEEVTAWISVSSGDASDQTEVTCAVENRDSQEIRLLGMEDKLVVKSINQGSFQSMAIRPHSNWEIGPGNRDTIMGMDLSLYSQGKISGAFCLRLLRHSQEHTDIITFPFEVHLDKKAAHADSVGSVSVSLDPLVPYDATEMVIAISLKNNVPYMLRVVNISKATETKFFHIKYNEGLLLFPGTVTQVAIVTCAELPSEFHDSPPEASDIENSCEVLILTNDPISPQMKILCRDIFHICLRNRKDSNNEKTGSLSNDLQLSSQFKTTEGAKPDELILGNWKSQGSSSELSVLKEYEILYPIAQVGTLKSKWITVTNPSQQPVMMQLILNSGEIIDECKVQDGFSQPSSSGSTVQSNSSGLKRHGFSIAENAVTEAYVHPHSEASFGPINFHPSDRCRWRSSALIRNNLSGVEWLALKGFGGSLSLTLLEGSKPVKTIEFSPYLPVPLNISPLGMFFHLGETASTCSQPLHKELYAKNTGDLPLEVQGIMVSGTKCGLDDFTVHQCKGFYLEPGESTKFLVSYQTDFSAPVVNRDLELAFASGVLVIPMKASMPVLMLNLCKKSVFWVRLKKFSVAVLLAASLIFLVLHCIFPQVMAISSIDHFYENKKSYPGVAIRGLDKSYGQLNQKNGKFPISAKMDCLLRSIGEETLGRFANGQDEASEIDATKDNTHQSGKSLASISAEQASEPKNNLTVKTGKDKKKRRKKKTGVVSGLTGLIEVSSSQSGNSTPTSPMSPAISRTFNPTFQRSPEPDQSQEVTRRNPFARVVSHTNKPASIPKLSEPSIPVVTGWSVSPQQSISKPVLSYSATFPSRSVCSVRCSSPLAPHARAPGSKSCNQKLGKAEENPGIGNNEYTYDIWGDHLSGLHLMDRFKDVDGGKHYSFAENESESFFVKGPQSFLANSRPRYASFFNRKE